MRINHMLKCCQVTERHGDTFIFDAAERKLLCSIRDPMQNKVYHCNTPHRFAEKLFIRFGQNAWLGCSFMRCKSTLYVLFSTYISSHAFNYFSCGHYVKSLCCVNEACMYALRFTYATFNRPLLSVSLLKGDIE